MIYCIWYPSGGFGHFINAILSVHGYNFVRPNNNIEFNNDGSCHKLNLIAPKFNSNRTYPQFEFDNSKNYSVLIDNGINNESTRYREFFPNSITLKLCYSDYSWPTVARTMIEKAMMGIFEENIVVNSDQWPTTEDWALRKKYFLYLRDHHLRHRWRPDAHCQNLFVDQLLSYSSMFSVLSTFTKLDNFELTWQQWRHHNAKYINPVSFAFKVINDVRSKKTASLLNTDIWTQAVVNYFIWLYYKVEVPANDYANWFTSTDEIAILLSNHGIII